MTSIGLIAPAFVLLFGVVAISLAWRRRPKVDPLDALARQYENRDKAMLRAQKRVSLKHQRHINRALEAVNREWSKAAPRAPDGKA